MRLLRILVLLPVVACGPTQVQDNDDVRIVVRPAPLWDDGSKATVVVNVVDKSASPASATC